jgi:hypothetical protein
MHMSHFGILYKSWWKWRLCWLLISCGVYRISIKLLKWLVVHSTLYSLFFQMKVNLKILYWCIWHFICSWISYIIQTNNLIENVFHICLLWSWECSYSKTQMSKRFYLNPSKWVVAIYYIFHMCITINSDPNHH